MASCADDLGAPHERVLESADLPLTSILAQLELRVVAAVARVCKLWHELSRSRLHHSHAKSWSLGATRRVAGGFFALLQGDRLVCRVSDRKLGVCGVWSPSTDWQYELCSTKPIRCVAADGLFVVCGGTFGELLVWLLPDDHRAGSEAAVHDASTSTALRPHQTLRSHSNDVQCVALRGGLLASTTSSELQTWERATALHSGAAAGGTAAGSTAAGGWMRRLACCGDARGTLCVHVASNGDVLCGVNGGVVVRSARTHADAVGAPRAPRRTCRECESEGAGLEDGATGSLPVVATLDHGAAAVLSIASDGDCVATGSDDGVARVWARARAVCVHVLAAHRDVVRAVALRDATLMSASLDDTLLVWGLQPETSGRRAGRTDAALSDGVPSETARRATVLPHDGMVFAVAVGDDYLVSGTGGRLLVWRGAAAVGEVVELEAEGQSSRAGGPSSTTAGAVT
jgi:hypothetical protein